MTEEFKQNDFYTPDYGRYEYNDTELTEMNDIIKYVDLYLQSLDNYPPKYLIHCFKSNVEVIKGYTCTVNNGLVFIDNYGCYIRIRGIEPDYISRKSNMLYNYRNTSLDNEKRKHCLSQADCLYNNYAENFFTNDNKYWLGELGNSFNNKTIEDQLPNVLIDFIKKSFNHINDFTNGGETMYPYRKIILNNIQLIANNYSYINPQPLSDNESITKYVDELKLLRRENERLKEQNMKKDEIIKSLETNQSKLQIKTIPIVNSSYDGALLQNISDLQAQIEDYKMSDTHQIISLKLAEYYTPYYGMFNYETIPKETLFDNMIKHYKVDLSKITNKINKYLNGLNNNRYVIHCFEISSYQTSGYYKPHVNIVIIDNYGCYIKLYLDNLHSSSTPCARFELEDRLLNASSADNLIGDFNDAFTFNDLGIKYPLPNSLIDLIKTNFKQIYENRNKPIEEQFTYFKLILDNIIYPISENYYKILYTNPSTDNELIKKDFDEVERLKEEISKKDKIIKSLETNQSKSETKTIPIVNSSYDNVLFQNIRDLQAQIEGYKKQIAKLEKEKEEYNPKDKSSTVSTPSKSELAFEGYSGKFVF
jgi:hypothetical protein